MAYTRKLENIGSFFMERYHRILIFSSDKEDLTELVQHRKERSDKGKSRGEASRSVALALNPSSPSSPESLVTPQIVTITSPSPPSMVFFTVNEISPLNVGATLNELSKNPEKLCPKYVYGESRIIEDCIKNFKEIFNQAHIAHMDVVCKLFPYSLGEFTYNWYLNLP